MNERTEIEPEQNEPQNFENETKTTKFVCLFVLKATLQTYQTRDVVI